VEGYAKVPGMQRSPFASCGTSFNIITKGMQRFWYAKVRVCKGPPLHQVPMIILVSLRQGKLASLESLYEACADGDIYTPLLLHTVRVCKGPWYAKVPGMQRSPFASCGTSFHLFPVLLMRYNCLHLILCSRKPLRGLCRWGHLHTLTTTHRKGMQRSPFA